MFNFVHIKDELKPHDKIIEKVPSGILLTDFLRKQELVNPKIYLNDELLFDDDGIVLLNIDDTYRLKDNDNLLIINTVKGVDPISIAIAVLVSTAVSYGLSVLLAEKPSIPTTVNQEQGETEYSISTSQNSARTGQPIPECFGDFVRYPDLISAPYYRYHNNDEYLYMMLCLGKGRISNSAGVQGIIKYSNKGFYIEDTKFDSFGLNNATSFVFDSDFIDGTDWYNSLYDNRRLTDGNIGTVWAYNSPNTLIGEYNTIDIERLNVPNDQDNQTIFTFTQIDDVKQLQFDFTVNFGDSLTSNSTERYAFNMQIDYYLNNTYVSSNTEVFVGLAKENTSEDFYLKARKTAPESYDEVRFIFYSQGSSNLVIENANILNFHYTSSQNNDPINFNNLLIPKNGTPVSATFSQIDNVKSSLISAKVTVSSVPEGADPYSFDFTVKYKLNTSTIRTITKSFSGSSYGTTLDIDIENNESTEQSYDEVEFTISNASSAVVSAKAESMVYESLGYSTDYNFHDFVITAKEIENFELSTESGKAMQYINVNDETTKAKTFEVDIVANGMYTQNNDGSLSTRSVEFKVDFLAIDTGISQTFTETISGATRDPIRQSFKYPLIYGVYAVKVTRITPDATDTKIQDKITVARIKAYVRNINHEQIRYDNDCTYCAVRVKATNAISSKGQFKVKFKGTRLYDDSYNNQLKSLEDVVSHIYKSDNGGRQDVANLDLPSMQEPFNAVISKRTSVYQAMKSVASVYGYNLFPVFNKISARKDESQPIRTMLFNDSNVINGTFKVEKSVNDDTDYDGIKALYLNADSFEEEYAIYPINSVYPQELRLDGVTDYNTALDRATFVYNQSKLRNIKYTFDTELDGHVPALYDRVGVTHHSLSDSVANTVVAVNGNELTLKDYIDTSVSVFSDTFNNLDNWDIKSGATISNGTLKLDPFFQFAPNDAVVRKTIRFNQFISKVRITFKLKKESANTFLIRIKDLNNNVIDSYLTTNIYSSFTSLSTTLTTNSSTFQLEIFAGWDGAGDILYVDDLDVTIEDFTHLIFRNRDGSASELYPITNIDKNKVTLDTTTNPMPNDIYVGLQSQRTMVQLGKDQSYIRDMIVSKIRPKRNNIISIEGWNYTESLYN